MRKALLTIPFIILLVVILIGPVNAVTVTVETVDCETHLPKSEFLVCEDLCVHLHSDTDASVWIYISLEEPTVEEPVPTPIDDTERYFELPAYEPVYERYDLHGLPLGTYYVIVIFEGEDAEFWVSFNVVQFFYIPELPLGTLMAVVAPLAAVAGLVTKKRLRLKH